MAKIKGLCKDDLTALDLIDRAVQRKHGGDRSKIMNHNLEPSPSPSPRSQQGILRSLRQNAPELHGKVLATGAR
jgi:hypothetical protein